MKIFIFVDMEGISGISGSEFVTPKGLFYQQGRKYYTMDVNACARGCYKAGADRVVVRDGHGGGNHLIWDELGPGIELIQGTSPFCRFHGIEECDALILLGYHAMAGTDKALLEHTYSSASVQNMWINDKLVGEFAIDSAIAAEYKVPTIMVSGDDKICLEAKQWIPDLVTCQVKKGISCQGTQMLPMEEAHLLIERKTEEAIAKINDIALPVVERPVRMRKEVIERGQIKRGDGYKNINARTFEVESDSVEKALFKMN